jgi:hypothetical protein
MRTLVRLCLVAAAAGLAWLARPVGNTGPATSPAPLGLMPSPAKALPVIPPPVAQAASGIVLPMAASVSYRVRPRIAKTDLTEAASDDDGDSGMPPTAATLRTPPPLKAIPAPPQGPEPKPNPPMRDPNTVYPGEGARDDAGG